MTLRRAVIFSMLAHACLVGAAGYALRPVLAGLVEGEEPVLQERNLHLNLVDPQVADLGPRDAPPAATHALPDPAGGSRGGARRVNQSTDAEPSPAAPAPAATPTALEARVDGAVADSSLEATVIEGPLAAAAGAAAPRSEPPGLLSPRQLADRVGLDTGDLEDDVLRGMFSAMHKYALQSPRPAASTYRQLLRAWVDGLMGYPYPVLEDLAGNAAHRFIGGIRIEVDAGGRFRLADLWIYPDVADPDGRLAGYYARVIRTASARPFLPPGDAGLPAPHALEYRIVNPKALR